MRFRPRLSSPVEVAHHLHLLARQAALFVKRDVVLRAVQDHLVAARGLGGGDERVDEALAEALAARGGVDDDVLDVADLFCVCVCRRCCEGGDGGAVSVCLCAAR